MFSYFVQSFGQPEEMKKVILGSVLAALLSCEYKDIAPAICYLVSEQTLTSYLIYSYDNNHQLTSYSSDQVSTSVLTYDYSGKIIAELDNGNIQITYDYDQKNQLVQWEELIANFPAYNFRTVFAYNAAGQDTLKQYHRYDPSSGSYYLSQFQRLTYASANTKNYSERKTYDGFGNLLFTESFQWDNHPNPHLTNPFFTNEPPPSNNILQSTFTPAGATPVTSSFTYTYNNNGFPLTQSMTGFSTIAVYTYTNCN